MKSLPTEVAPHQIKLRFFDLEVNLKSDTHGYIDLFGRMYRRFQANASDPAAVRSPVEFGALTKPDNPWGKPVMVLDGEVWPLNSTEPQHGYVYDSILKAIVAGVRSHFLIHAGVVASQGQGIILAADAYHGKTTLVLELLRRGFNFLSDEMAALGRADGWVYPFPRSLRIRPGTLKLAGFPGAAIDTPRWLDKYLLDIEEIQPGSMGKAVPISHIIILRDPTAPGLSAADSPERELSVLVNRFDETLLRTVRQLEGVNEVCFDVERGYPALRLRTAQRMAVLSQIEAMCHERQVLILDISKRAETQPTFDTPARLEVIPPSEAILELLRRFQGGHKSAILQSEFNGSSTRLFMELAGLVSRANCYRLFVGPLREAADLICDLVTSSRCKSGL